jgi:Pyruvate/2-oxoacid:ferredoxin oxidoreductase delta subunit/flavodoxin
METLNPRVGLVYFSPTGTTKKICETIASTISTQTPIRIDLTNPVITTPKILHDIEVLVVGIPIYASRMPTIAREKISQTLEQTQAKTPAIAVALYGNVDVGGGLKQLVELLSRKGLNVIGAGEFIGEHYFKRFHGITPHGTVSRPNEEDLDVARELGKTVAKKGFNKTNETFLAEVQSAEVPLKFRFTSERRVLGLLGPSMIDLGKCTKCRACVKACPAHCIDSNTLIGDPTKGCLGCGNCMRVCPNNARSQTIKMKWIVERMAKPRDPPAKSRYYA